MQGQIVQINLSNGGVPKLPVPEAEIRVDGLRSEFEGQLLCDRQKNLKHHGGPNRAVCLWSAEIIAALQAEGHPIAPGSTGENLTICGLAWEQLAPGMRLSLGQPENAKAPVILELTDYARPCRTIAKYFSQRRYGRISQKRNPGQSRLYAKVIAEGHIRVGDPVERN